MQRPLGDSDIHQRLGGNGIKGLPFVVAGEGGISSYQTPLQGIRVHEEVPGAGREAECRYTSRVWENEHPQPPLSKLPFADLGFIF